MIRKFLKNIIRLPDCGHTGCCQSSNRQQPQHITPLSCGEGQKPCSARLGVGLLLLLLLVSCARMGQPDGGWYDETPPKVVGAQPADRGVNVTSKKVSIFFDEFVKLENASEKVVVSPPQLEQPEIKTAGKRIEVKLADSLKTNTTYTIDFSDAITDNNEGNPLGNYTYSFSTGPQIDTLEVAGTVLQADNLEPVKGTLVGLYSEMADSCFMKTPMLRVARTDSRGRFVIRGVAPGSYRVYALADADGNYMFSQKSEQIAFSTDTIKPHVIDDMRQDTLWRDSLRIKDIKQVKYRHFLPDDIVLRAFNEVVTDRYFIKSERQEADNFKLYFSYGDKEMPQIRGLNFNADRAFVTEVSPKRDTLTYWLRDTALVNRDTLDIELKYNMTDSLGHLVSQTDTLQLLSKQPYERRMKQLKKDMEEWEKKQAKLKKRGEPYDSVYPKKEIDMKLDAPSELDPDRNIRFTFRAPLARVDTSMIHLYAKHDSLWYNARFEFVAVSRADGADQFAEADSTATSSTAANLTTASSTSANSTAANSTAADGSTALGRLYELRGEWRPDIEYSLEIDSTAFEDIYGLVSPTVKKGFKVPSLDSYGTLLLNIGGMGDTPCFVELLDSNDKPVKKARVGSDGTAQFFYLKEGSYYARLIADRNNNFRWDTGLYEEGRQPEEVFYFNEKIECKAKWDISRNWQPRQRRLDQQKPDAITKQKGEKQKTIQQRNLQRAQKLGIEPPKGE